jgi:hypothetical protein
MTIGLFGTESDRNTGTAESLMDAAKQTDIVSTAQPVTEYRNIEESEVKQAQENLKREQKWTQNWAKFLQINLKHQQLDIQRTKDWAQWRVGTTKELANKALIVAKQGASQSIIAAQYTAQVGMLQASTQSRIQEIQQKADQARSKLGARR